VKPLPLVPDGCGLTPSGLDVQQARGEALRPSVRSVEHAPGELRVAFGPEVDEDLVAELVATEQSCCSFLEIAYDDGVLHVASPDRRDVVALFAGFFAEGRR
jgi:hypothetical protein